METSFVLQTVLLRGKLPLGETRVHLGVLCTQDLLTMRSLLIAHESTFDVT